MPELPEVQTTVNGLNATVKGRIIKDVWTDYQSQHKMHQGSVKDADFFKIFKKKVEGKRILKAERRAKNILIHLSGGKTILIHMKMTGHLLYGKYKLQDGKWIAVDSIALKDSFNSFIRLMFILDNGKHLAFSDMRRFGKVTLIPTKELSHSPHLAGIGPEPLDKSFQYADFKSQLEKRANGKIKQVLMDQMVIAGIGNIYSDEMLWRAGVHPLSRTGDIPLKNMKSMFAAMKEVLERGIDFGGDSMSDYRNIKGEKGEFQDYHQAYRRTGKPCNKRGCKGVIKRTVVGGRSAHYCSNHQKLFQ